MNEIMNFMGNDHDRLDGIFREFQILKNKDLSKAKNLFSDFKSGLERHIVWEEEILFPVFENRTGMRETGPTAVMRMEHRQIEQYLGSIHDALSRGDAQTDEFEGRLLEVLTAHNEKEENVLYPWIDDSVTEEERKQLLEKMTGGSARS